MIACGAFGDFGAAAAAAAAVAVVVDVAVVFFRSVCCLVSVSLVECVSCFAFVDGSIITERVARYPAYVRTYCSFFFVAFLLYCSRREQYQVAARSIPYFCVRVCTRRVWC